VVEDHQGLRLESLVLYFVFDPHTWFADSGRDTAPQNQVGTEDACLPDLPSGFEDAAFTVPGYVVGDSGGGNVGSATVEAEFFAFALARRSGVS
jgi:hypothetical protein